MEFVVLGLLGVGFFLLGPIAFFMVLGARTRLDYVERKAQAFEARIADLERGASWPSAAENQQPAEPDMTQVPLPGGALQNRDDEAAPGLQGEPKPFAQAAREGEALASADNSGQSPPERPAAKPSGPSFEERLGTRWTVWVGGLALALGGLLLVRYAFEQGLFGPAIRVAMGFVLALALIGAGEYLRRREIAAGEAGDVDTFDWRKPSIPAMLTAAGTIAAFGTIYAAHALYGFIGPAFAFVALGATGVATMFAAALHGPLLAGAGLAGAMIAPMLVSSNTPSPWPVVLYLLVVAVAAYSLARLRNWLWLAAATGGAAALWLLALLDVSGSANFRDASLVHLVLQSALALAVFCWAPFINVHEAEKPDTLASAVTLVCAAFATVALAQTSHGSTTSSVWVIAAALAVILHGATGFRIAPAATGLVTGGMLVLATLAVWLDTPSSVNALTIPEYGPLPTRPAGETAFSAFALLLAGAIGAAATWRIVGNKNLNMLMTCLYAATALLTPLLALIIAYVRFSGGAPSTLFAALACALALAFTLCAQLFRNSVKDFEPAAWNLSLGLYASAALTALALALTFTLDGGSLTVALALAALGAAYVSVKLNIPALRWCVAGFGAAVAARYMWDPRIGVLPGTTPIFNWLLFGYGVPAIAFGIAARLMRRHAPDPANAEDRPVQIAQALTIMCSALLAFFQIRHFANGGDTFAMQSNLFEQGLMAVTSFAFSIVLLRLDLQRHSQVFRIASYIFAIVSVALSAAGLGIFHNPVFSGDTIEGGTFFNELLLAYLVPGVLALLAGRMADGLRPRWYVMMMRIAAIALVFAWCCLQTRRFFQGPTIGLMRRTSDDGWYTGLPNQGADVIGLLRGTTDGEWYTYSALLLIFGIALLAYGLWRRSVEVRLASAIFIVASVLKVFLLDLQGLTGVLRALSFIGLGVVLIGIGLVYQKFVFASAKGGEPDGGPDREPDSGADPTPNPPRDPLPRDPLPRDSLPGAPPPAPQT